MNFCLDHNSSLGPLRIQNILNALTDWPTTDWLTLTYPYKPDQGSNCYLKFKKYFFLLELNLETGNALLWANQIFQEEGNPFSGTSTLFVRHRALNAIAVFDALGKLWVNFTIFTTICDFKPFATFNGKVDLNWLSLPLESYKIRRKKLFLQNNA